MAPGGASRRGSDRESARRVKPRLRKASETRQHGESARGWLLPGPGAEAGEKPSRATDLARQVKAGRGPGEVRRQLTVSEAGLRPGRGGRRLREAWPPPSEARRVNAGSSPGEARGAWPQPLGGERRRRLLGAAWARRVRQGRGQARPPSRGLIQDTRSTIDCTSTLFCVEIPACQLGKNVKPGDSVHLRAAAASCALVPARGASAGGPGPPCLRPAP